jgi:hypothetical protein
MSEKTKCKAAEGCEKDGRKMGMCGTHYMQVRRGVRSPEGFLLRDLRPRYVPGTHCNVKDCLRAPLAQGLCSQHYQLFRFNRIDKNGNPTDPSTWQTYFNPNRTSPGTAGPCKLDGCGRQKVSTDLGLCGYHYRRFQLGIIDSEGTLLREDLRRRRYTDADICPVPGCGKKSRSNRFCKYHAERFTAGIIDSEGKSLRTPTIGRPRKLNARWVSGGGYIYVKAPEGHPYANRDGMIFEHRFVMEQLLGRYLEPHELVHHKDGNRQNNATENLELLTRKRHPIGREYTREQVEKALTALQHNEPEEYSELLNKLTLLPTKGNNS